MQEPPVSPEDLKEQQCIELEVVSFPKAASSAEEEKRYQELRAKHREAEQVFKASGLARGMKAIHFAARAGHTEIVKFLIEKMHVYVDSIDSTRLTALHYAVTAGANVHIVNFKQQTPLDLVILASMTQGQVASRDLELGRQRSRSMSLI